MKGAKNKIREKQFAVMSKAREWAKGHCPMMVKRSVLEAARICPISDMQWYHLQEIVGGEMVRDLRRLVGGTKC